MIPRIFELRSVESQPYQPYSEGEQFIVTLRFSHNSTALGDGFRGHGEAQIDISGNPTGMKGGVEAPPLHCASVEHGVQIQGMISGPMIMIRMVGMTLVPDIFQLR